MPWNITTAPTDLERIRRALKVPAETTYLDILRTAMSRVEKQSPDSIATVQEILDELDGNRTKRKVVLGDASYALTEADVLKWQAGAKADGIDTLRVDWLEELTAALYLKLPNQAYSYGTLGRS